MNAAELRRKVCDRVTATLPLNKGQVNAVLDSLADVVRAELLGSNTSVSLLGLGHIYSEEVRPRNYHNLWTGKMDETNGHRRVRFSMSNGLKRQLNP